MKHLNFEISSATNIKNKSVRLAVIKALKNLSNNIDKYVQKNRVPENGLVMLSGTIDNDIEYYV